MLITDDSKWQQSPTYWEPFKQMQAIGEIDNEFKRMTLEEVKQIITESKTSGEIVKHFIERQPYCDVYYMGNLFIRMSYYLNEDQDSNIVKEINVYYCNNNVESVEYYVIRMDGGKPEVQSKEILYGNDSSDENNEGMQEQVDSPASKNPFLYYNNSKESQKIYEELDEKQRDAQRFTHNVVGYKKLTDEQLENLLKITENTEDRQDDSNWEPFRQVQAIGETDPDFKRMTLDDVKKIISDSKTAEEVLNGIYTRQPYCDKVYEGNFTGLTFNLLDENEEDNIHEVVSITYYSVGNMRIDYLKYILDNDYYELLEKETLYQLEEDPRLSQT